MTSPSSNSPSLGSSFSLPFLAATIPFITLFIALLLTIAHHIITIKLSQTKSLPPGPPALPFLGNLSLILRPNLHHRLADLSLTYGPIIRLRLGTKLWIVISSPTIAKQIFTEKDLDFSNHEQPIAATVISYGGSNLVRCPYGSTWRMLRRVFVHELVNAKSLDAAAQLRRGEMKRVVRDIWAKRGMSSINVGELGFEVSLNMLMTMLCGEEESVKWREKGGEFRKVMMETVELLGRQNVSDYLPLISWLDLQGIERGMKKRVEWMDRVYEEMIEEKMRMREYRGAAGDEEEGESGKEGKDLLSKLLKIRDGEDHRFKLSNIQLKGLIMVKSSNINKRSMHEVHDGYYEHSLRTVLNFKLFD